MKALAAVVAAFAATMAPAQDQPSSSFAPPVQLQAGDKFLGHERLFPSPVYHDVDGDGLADLVVGDLIGHLTVALRKPGKKISYGAESKLKGADGKDLKFHNW